MIAVVGGKKSGKTTTIEILTKELVRRGYRIAVVKHIPEPNFTFDKEGKDTWRFAQAGAKTVIGASAEEIATIEKVHAQDVSLEAILRRCGGNDIAFLEGFRHIVARDRDVIKIAVLKSAEDFSEAVKIFRPILAFTGPHSPEKQNHEIPYVDLFGNPEKLVDLVEMAVKKRAAT